MTMYWRRGAASGIYVWHGRTAAMIPITLLQSRRFQRALALMLSALLVDAAVETFRSGSPVRWWLVAATAAYFGIVGAAWRTRNLQHRQAALLVVAPGCLLLAFVVASAWTSNGLTNGIRILGQPTSTVLSALAAAGVALAGMTIARSPDLPLALRAAVGLLTVYGVIAFVAGAIDRTPFAALLAGQSLWQRLPAVLQGAFLGGIIVLPLGLIWSSVKAGVRRPLRASIRAELWRVTAIAASLAIVLAGLPLRSRDTGPAPPGAQRSLASALGIDPDAPTPSPAELDAALANSFRAIEDGEREVPRDRWDPVYLANALGSDPQQIFSWVQWNTFWIPYRGLLRGPVGMLMDRLGNSLDRAVLLATLLRHSKRTVRLAHGSLSREQVTQLLPSLLTIRYAVAPRVAEASRPDAPALVAADYQLDETSVRKTLTAQSDTWARKETELLSRVPGQTKRLREAVPSRSRESAQTAFERSLDAAADHWWVQVLEGATWRDFDLLSSSVGVALTSPDRSIALESVPGDLRHQVTVRVIAEQWTGGRLVEHVALQHTLRPSDLVGTPIVLQFAAVRWPKTFPLPNVGARESLRQLALNQQEWTGSLVIGQKPIVQATLRDTGDVTRGRGSGATGGAFGGLGRTLNEALATPGSSPASDPKADGSKVLTSAWIEYELQTPGEQPRKIRRVVFDLVGPAGRAAKPAATPQLGEAERIARSLGLMKETEILPVICRFTPEYVTHLGARSVLANRSVLTELVNGKLSDDFATAQRVAKRLAPMPSPLYNLALARFDWSRFGEHIYIDRPNVLTRHTYFAPKSKGFVLVSATDIVANDIGVDFMAGDPFGVRLEQGVLDTNAEAILASDRPDASNAGWALAGSGTWTTLSSPADPQLGTLQLPDDVRQRIAADLVAGYVVVAPKAPVTVGTEAFTGWWRVDPASGQALGMGSTGWGSQYVEYLITLELLAVSFLFAYLLCRTPAPPGEIAGACEPSGNRRFAIANYFVAPLHAAPSGCLVEALIGMVIGALLGALAGGAARALSRFGGGRSGGGSSGGSGSGSKSGSGTSKEPPADPFGKTHPAPGQAPGKGSGKPGASGGGKPGGGRSRSADSTSDDPFENRPEDLANWQDAIKRLEDGHRKMKKLLDEGGSEAEILATQREVTDAFHEMVYWKMTPQERAAHAVPKGERQLWYKHWPLDHKSPATGGNPNPTTGPGGTQIILPRTGPTGTQIIPPSTGPSGTQIIPPPPSCPGPGCPPPAPNKSLTGLGGVLNTLGKKGSG